MPHVVIPRGEGNSVDLPAICLVTGATENVRWVPRALRHSSPWWFLALAVTCINPGLMLLALPAMLAIRVLTGKRMEVELPLTDEGERLSARGELIRNFAFGAVMATVITLPFVIVWAVNNDKGRLPINASLLAFGASIVAAMVQSATSGRQRIWVRSINKAGADVAIPSSEAAGMFYKRLHGWTPELDAPWSTRRTDELRDCPSHAGVPARWVCGRCGRFACNSCMERVRPDSMLICRSCLARRTG
ncbi:MAG: hypothetical protein JST54_29270 [Deltaproteobacteria bacterium]|nr:hypothetical protein [Deltaproteobacteria bacterium]